MRTAFITLGALALTAPSIAAETLVVDANNGPGTDFSTIVDAIAAAADGDLLLVRDGVYESFQLANRGLSIVAAPGAVPRIEGPPVIVTNVPASSLFLISGFGDGEPGQSGLQFVGNAGPIIVQDCNITASVSNPIVPLAVNAILALGCEYLVVTGCRAEGAPRSIEAEEFFLGAGLYIEDCFGLAQHSEFIGGAGGDGQFVAPFGFGTDGFDGGPGIFCRNASLSVESSSWTGGRGGAGALEANTGDCTAGGAGGIGFDLSGSNYFLRDAVGFGGQGGDAPGGCNGGADGLELFPTFLPPASDWSGGKRTLSSAPLIEAGQTFDVSFEGEPGEVVVWFVFLEVTLLPLDRFNGGALGYDLIQPFSAGALNAAGQLTLSAPTPTVVAGASIPILHQAIVGDFETGFLTTNARAAVFTD